MPYRGEKQREYQRQWVAARRAEWIKIHGPCQRCGSWLGLEIDHIDPAKKERIISGIWSHADRDVELAKCQVLCHSCHLRKTAAEHTGRRPKVDCLIPGCGKEHRAKGMCHKHWMQDNRGGGKFRRVLTA